MSYIVPIILLLVFIYAIIKKLPIYSYFIDGAKGALPLVFTIFPYIACIFILVELFTASGASNYLATLLSPILKPLGIPSGIFELVLFRPFSGSGSIAILEKIFLNYGVDSYEGKCASIICGSSETIFYLAAVYFADSGIKKLKKAIPISLICALFTVVFGCFLARFF